MGYKHGWSDNARLYDGIRKREAEIRDKYHEQAVDKIEKDIVNQQRCDVCGEFYHPDAINERKCFNCSEQVEDEKFDNEIDK